MNNKDQTPTINVLVSGASGIVGYGILRSLKDNGYNLIGTTIHTTSPANCFSHTVLTPPKSSDPFYISWLVKTIQQYNINILFPGIEADMEVWNNHREVFRSLNCTVVLNNEKLIDLCLDKWSFYCTLENADIKCRIPTYKVSDVSNIAFPFIVKPRKGFGSNGVKIIRTSDEYLRYCNEYRNEYIVQPIVGSADEEYTISAFFDNNSNIKAVIPLKRSLSKQGFTDVAEVVDIYEQIIPTLNELAELFHPIGPTNFQFRKIKTDWKLLEINPRISSSTSIRTSFGYNEAQMSIDYFLFGKEITQPRIKYGKAIRYTEDFILDSSDI